MPDFNRVELIFVMDRSGSMRAMQDEAIGGFNAFVDDQKVTNPDGYLSYIQFDHEYTPVYFGKPIVEVPHLNNETYIPRGTTALLDAVGRAIIDAGKTFDDRPEDKKPGKVIVAIMTDGQENASKDFTFESLSKLINQQENEWGWDFIYLSSSPTAVSDGIKCGFKGVQIAAIANTGDGTRRAFSSVSHYASARAAGSDIKIQDLYSAIN